MKNTALLKRILLTILTLVIVACIVGSALAALGALVMLQTEVGGGGSFMPDAFARADLSILYYSITRSSLHGFRFPPN